jgi:hypothetical protein
VRVDQLVGIRGELGDIGLGFFLMFDRGRDDVD